MPAHILMPKLGLTMTEGLIVEWKKKEGDHVRKGEILFVLETEKVTYEVEANEDGVLGKILVREKETVPVGAVVSKIILSLTVEIFPASSLNFANTSLVPSPSERVQALKSE